MLPEHRRIVHYRNFGEFSDPVVEERVMFVAGLPAEQAGQGSVQAEHPQLLGADQRQPDAEHHHVQTGQASQGRLRTTARQEGGKCRTSHPGITNRCYILTCMILHHPTRTNLNASSIPVRPWVAQYKMMYCATQGHANWYSICLHPFCVFKNLVI